MLTDDDIRKFGFESGLLRLKDNTITRWKDGIDIDYPVLAVEKFARAVEAAAYVAAIKACEGLENRVISTHPARIEFDPNSLMARKCADLDHLVMLVTKKYPGESRYDTAARYIREADEGRVEVSAAQEAKDQK